MRVRSIRLLLILITSVAALATAADTASVRLVFSGHGASEYHKWLSRNAKEYSALMPIYVQIDSEVEGDSGRYTYYVSFLDDSGLVAKRRVLSGKRRMYDCYFTAWVSSSGGWLIVRDDRHIFAPDSAVTTAYGPTGDSLFSVVGGAVSGDAGLYFRTFRGEEGDPYRRYMELLDSRGRLSDTIGGPWGPSVQAHVWSQNKTHALYVSDSVGNVIAVDNRGRILWQYPLWAETDANVAISEDGRFVAIAAWESLMVRGMSVGQTFARPLRDGGQGRFVGPKVAISTDNRFVAVARTHASKHDSILVDVFTTSGAAVCTSLALCTGHAASIGFVGDGLGIVAFAPVGPDADAPRDPSVPHPKPPPEEPCRLVVVGLDGQLRTWDGIGSPRLQTPFKLTGNAVALYGKDSISVYRIGTGAPEQRK